LFGYTTLNKLSGHVCFSALSIKQGVYQTAQALTESRFIIVDI
jgi:hypothetical protein